MADPDAVDQQRGPKPHAILRYTTLRLAIFIAVLLLLWLVRIRDGVLLVAIALLVSGLASYVLLGSQRDAMSAQLHAATARRRDRANAKAAREDDEPDDDSYSGGAFRSEGALHINGDDAPSA